MGKRIGVEADMDDPRQYLTETEKNALNSRTEVRRAAALANIAEFAIAIDDFDKLRQLDDDSLHRVGKKIGKITRNLVKLFDSDTSAVVTLDPQPEPEAEHETGLEPDPQPNIEIAEPVASVAALLDVVQPEAQPEGLSESAEKWLSDFVGPDWRNALSLEGVNDEAIIVSRIMQLAPPRATKNQENYTQRLELRLRGMTPQQIAVQLDVEPNALRMYYLNFKKRLGQQLAQPTNPSEYQPEATALDPPRVALAMPRPPMATATHTEESVMIDARDVMVTPESHEPPKDRYASILQERLGLDSASREALRGFLDPKKDGDLTSVRRLAVESVTDYIRPLLDDPLYNLDDNEKRWVRTSFGVFVKNGDPIQGEPRSLYQLAVEARRKNPAVALQIPDLIYGALEKLFVAGPNVQIQELGNTEFLQAAIYPAVVSEERFDELKEELLSYIEKVLGEDDARIIVDSISSGGPSSYYGGASEKAKKGAFSKVRQDVMAKGELRTGWRKIDEALRQFLVGNKPASGVRNIIATDTPAQIERYIVAGLYVHYHQAEEISV